jgi:hypothetical protein
LQPVFLQQLMCLIPWQVTNLAANIWLEDDALECLRAESETHFNPQVMEVFWDI